MRTWARWSVVVVLLVGTAVAWADSGGPPRSRTGAASIGGVAAEGNCTGCHGDFALNTTGSVSVSGAPGMYVPGHTYDLSVIVTTANTAGSANRVWGFELTAVRTSNGTGAGTFANVTGQNTGIIAGSGAYATRSYIEQTNARQGSASPVTFVVRWTAPNPGVGGVNFYASAVAGDGSGDETGDYVYTTTKVMADTTTAASTTSWGQVKARYR